MKKNKGLLGKGLELLVLAAIAGTLIAGCGGGGGSSTGGTIPNYQAGGSGGGASGKPSAAGSALASYIADAQGLGFAGLWINTNFAGSTQSAVAFTTNLVSAGSPGTYGISEGARVLKGTWSTAALTASDYNLTTAGWVKTSLTGNTLVDSGDGTNATENRANGATVQYAVTQTVKTGATISCTTATGAPTACAGPNVYPAGAAWYTLTYKTALYTLYGNPGTTPVTDGAGVVMTALPVIGTATFCDPYWNRVFKPIAGAAAGAPNYSVFMSGGCSAAAISTALAGTAAGTVIASLTPTGNAIVPNVVTLSGWTGTLAAFNIPFDNIMYGANAGQLWPGVLWSAGFTDTQENKTAINAELAANGFAAIP